MENVCVHSPSDLIFRKNKFIDKVLSKKFVELLLISKYVSLRIQTFIYIQKNIQFQIILFEQNTRFVSSSTGQKLSFCKKIHNNIMFKVLFVIIFSLYGIFSLKTSRKNTREVNVKDRNGTSITMETNNDFERLNDAVASSLKLSGHGMLQNGDVIHSYRTGPLQILFQYLIAEMEKKENKTRFKSIWEFFDVYKQEELEELAPQSFGQVGRLQYKFKSENKNAYGFKVQNLIACQCLQNVIDNDAHDQCNDAVQIKPVVLVNGNISKRTCIYEKNLNRKNGFTPCFTELLRSGKVEHKPFKAPVNQTPSSFINLEFSYSSQFSNHGWTTQTVRPWEWQCRENELENVTKIYLSDITHTKLEKENFTTFEASQPILEPWGNKNISCINDRDSVKKDIEFYRLFDEEGEECYELFSLARNGALWRSMESTSFTSIRDGDYYLLEKPDETTWNDIFLIVMNLVLYAYTIIMHRNEEGSKDKRGLFENIGFLFVDIFSFLQVILSFYLILLEKTWETRSVQLDATLAYKGLQNNVTRRESHKQSIEGSIVVLSVANGILKRNEIVDEKIAIMGVLVCIQLFLMFIFHSKRFLEHRIVLASKIIFICIIIHIIIFKKIVPTTGKRDIDQLLGMSLGCALLVISIASFFMSIYRKQAELYYKEYPKREKKYFLQ